MRWLLDLLYLLAAVLTCPLWLTQMIRTGKMRTDWGGRFGRVEPWPKNPARPRLVLHAVSVGELNAIRLLVQQFQAREPDIELIISTTTDTGFHRATTLFGDLHRVVRYPYDFSWSVSRFLEALQPDAVCLVELEVWPNFCHACARRKVPVCIINGRLTARSFKRYRWVKFLIGRWFARLAFAAVQNSDYAARFAAMGVPDDRLHVTGTMKWDTAQIEDDVPGAAQLAEELGIDRHLPLVVAGSTAPGEHELLAQAIPDGVQLLCAPRRPEWFDQAADALSGCARRSRGEKSSSTGRFLLDTIGELRMAYALADIVVIGRSFVALHGSDMMEPIALGKPTIVGPAVADFQSTTEALLHGDGIVQVPGDQLAATLVRLLEDSNRRAELASNGRNVIRAHQGATDRHFQLLKHLLATKRNSPFQREAETAKEKKEERTR